MVDLWYYVRGVTLSFEHLGKKKGPLTLAPILKCFSLMRFFTQVSKLRILYSPFPVEQNRQIIISEILG